ncbi:U1 small nuclear ribonucleoprotein 70 kDa-like [Onychostoma macrolepis]|uniref:U1 small nuclear ribonucleoprotein 70 kDa-like n=1 Tax=Onychostoma macrolepis TaxID=369639 RepID=UPI00272D6B20|nr:U1 small nuclear ribonucleoprotein 70 kDa-like [Onychostoma macrolepis]
MLISVSKYLLQQNRSRVAETLVLAQRAQEMNAERSMERAKAKGREKDNKDKDKDKDKDRDKVMDTDTDKEGNMRRKDVSNKKEKSVESLA